MLFGGFADEDPDQYRRFSPVSFLYRMNWIGVAFSDCIKDAHAGGGPVSADYIGDPPGDEGQIAPRVSLAFGNHRKDAPLN